MNTLNLKKQTSQESANVNSADNVFMKIKDRFQKVQFNDILYIEAAGGYCKFHFATGATTTIAYRLTEAKQHLPNNLFVQVHRSFIVNINHVSSFIGNIIYINEHPIPIGRVYKKETLSHFNIIGIDTD